ncbi:MAG: AAA family ATPase [Candidatus Competibacter sp.]
MKTIGLVCQKGGVGKTTLAIHLAYCAQKARRRAVVIDIDPQGSAASWNKTRAANGEEPLDIVQTDISQLRATLAAAEQRHAELVIIDTPGEGENIAATVAKLADFVIIPARPVYYDLASAAQSIVITRDSGTPFAVLFNHTPHGFTTVDRARGLLEANNIPVLPNIVHLYAAFCHSAEGSTVFEYEPDGNAVADIKTLYHDLQKAITA